MKNPAIDDPEIVVEQPLPHEQQEEAGDCKGNHEQRSIQALQAHALLVERDREKESESEREEHRARSERKRPGEHAEKRLAHEWVVNHPAEVPQADSGSPTGLQLL